MRPAAGSSVRFASRSNPGEHVYRVKLSAPDEKGGRAGRLKTVTDSGPHRESTHSANPPVIPPEHISAPAQRLSEYWVGGAPLTNSMTAHLPVELVMRRDYCATALEDVRIVVDMPVARTIECLYGCSYTVDDLPH